MVSGGRLRGGDLGGGGRERRERDVLGCGRWANWCGVV